MNPVRLLRSCPGLVAVLALCAAAPCAAQDPALVAGENFSLALHKDGVVFAWGQNDAGQLGDGSTTMRLRPVKVTGINPVTQLAAGKDHVLAILEDKTVWSWGRNNHGQLGDGKTVARSKPGIVAGLSQVKAVAAGEGFSLALREDGTLWAWGRNNFGQLGDGSTTTRLRPVQITLGSPPANFAGFTRIAAGAFHALALDGQKRLYSWGDNIYGQLGHGNTTSLSVPTIVSNLEQLDDIRAGYAHSYGLSATRSLYGWGLNFAGQLGLDNVTTQKAPVCLTQGCNNASAGTTLAQVQRLAAGYNHVFATDLVSGKVYWWGQNSAGQLGNNAVDFANVTIPKTDSVLLVDDLILFAGGGLHSLGMNAEGQVYAWGSNGSGQAGVNSLSTAQFKIPTAVFGLSGNTTLNLQTDIPQGTDTTPDTVVFAPANGVGRQTEIRSSEIVITGIDAATPVSIVGGEYVINPANPIDSATFTSALGQVNAGDRIVVRHFSAAGASETTTTTLTVGTETLTFTSTTAGAGGEGGGGGCSLRSGQRDLSLGLLALVALAAHVRRSHFKKATP